MAEVVVGAEHGSAQVVTAPFGDTLDRPHRRPTPAKVEWVGDTPFACIPIRSASCAGGRMHSVDPGAAVACIEAAPGMRPADGGDIPAGIVVEPANGPLLAARAEPTAGDNPGVGQCRVEIADATAIDADDYLAKVAVMRVQTVRNARQATAVARPPCCASGVRQAVPWFRSVRYQGRSKAGPSNEQDAAVPRDPATRGFSLPSRLRGRGFALDGVRRTRGLGLTSAAASPRLADAVPRPRELAAA